MEVKKSDSADLEQKRLSFFLLGLILALSAFIVLLEYTSSDDIGGDEVDTADFLEADLKRLPLKKQQDMIPLIQPPKKVKESPKINIVDEHVDKVLPKLLEPIVPSKAEGDISELIPVEDNEGSNAVSPIAQSPDNPLNFQVVEELPDFPGGMVKFMKWLTRHLKYPQDAQRKKLQGQVTVQFIINTDGSVTDPKIIKSLSPSCDREVLRVVRMMPKWKPGTDHGKPVRTKFVIPVVFSL